MQKKPFLKIPESLPEWFQLMNDKAIMTTTDVKRLFGFNDINSIKAGKGFPVCDVQIRKSGGKFRNTRVRVLTNGWCKSTIMKEINRRINFNRDLEALREEKKVNKKETG